MPARSVTVIPATVNPRTHLPSTAFRKRKTGGYARVSTDKDEQFTSYEAQVDYYTKLIKSNPDWEFVKVYTDEGISGTNTKRRDGFKEMIEDALAGKLDLIVTKSISRFARNTVDTLVTIRKLKEKGVEVYFEKENIHTLDSNSELVLTIMSSLAQEESRSISENVTWGQRKRFADGKVSMAFKSFLGYKKEPYEVTDENGRKIIRNRIAVDETEAATVRRIYSLFMEGMTACGIAALLTEEGIPTPMGKQQWGSTTIESILTNEKYKGDAILQKTYTVDFLNKVTKINEGEVPQYYVENSHPAIIDRQEWNLVQAEFARRKSLGRKYSGNGIFASRIICGDCGALYGAKVWHSNSKYRRTIWQCNAKFKGKRKCTTPHVEEATIKAKFLLAYNQLMVDREQLLEDCRIVQATLTDCASLETEAEALGQEMEVVAGLTRKCIEENARIPQSQEDFERRYNGLVRRFETAKAKLDSINAQRMERRAKADAIGGFLFAISEGEVCITEFDPRLWTATVDTVTVHPDGLLSFLFKNGSKIDI